MRGFKKKTGCIFIIPLLCLCAVSCSKKEPSLFALHENKGQLTVFPYYADGLVLPKNIAPLNFMLPDSIRNARIDISLVKGVDDPFFSTPTWVINTIDNKVVFPLRFWKKLLQEAYKTRSHICLHIEAQCKDKHYLYPCIYWRVEGAIDPYITYRSVQPLAPSNQTMVLKERCLENFQQKVLVSSEGVNNQCFNCHTYQDGNPESMMLHLRGENGGTVIYRDGKIEKIVLPHPNEIRAALPDSLQMPLNLVYPTWSADGKWLAFSTVNFGIEGYEQHRFAYNMFDSASNIVLYNTEDNRLVFDPLLWTAGYEETWPAWSPDGEWLYFCRTPKENPDSAKLYSTQNERVRHIFFDLARLRFDKESGRFKGPVETVLKGVEDQSFSIPSISTDGKFLLCSRSLFNSIPYSAQGDLVLVDIEKFDSLQRTGYVSAQAGGVDPAFARTARELNSDEAESWHQWSHSGNWVLVNSKRYDGNNLLPYFAWFDGNSFSHPFVLPQKDPEFYQTNFRSFNLCTFAKAKSNLKSRKVARAQRREGCKINIGE